jgi:2'-5' RNA ligase
MSRFFIALLPPQHIQDYVNEVKQHFANNYASSGAQKSPPHITLQPPFEWSDDNVTLLEEFLRQFALGRESVPVTLRGFSAFAPRVIYIGVVSSPKLTALQTDLMENVENNLGIVDPVSQTRAFSPHMTVAFRDLTKQNFQTAWQEFEKRQLDFDFTAENLTLLRHDGQRWNVKIEFPFFS